MTQTSKRVHEKIACLSDLPAPNPRSQKRRCVSSAPWSGNQFTSSQASKRNDPKTQFTEPYYKEDYDTIARYLMRCVHPSVEISQLVKNAFGNLSVSSQSLDPKSQELLTFIKQDTRFNTFLKILEQNFPSTSEGHVNLKKVEEVVLKPMKDIYTKTRYEDIQTLKIQVLSYIVLAGSEHYATLPLLNPKIKTSRGFHHNITARLLCPIQFIKEYDSNPTEFRRRVNAGEFNGIKAGYFPSFLYDEEEFFVKGRGQDPLAGFLKGHVFMKAFRGIWDAPLVDFSRPHWHWRGPKYSANIQTLNITKITPEMLAYVAMLTRFSLSDAVRWFPVDRGFNHHTFFEAIVETFNWKADDDVEDDEDPTKDIMEFWNLLMFKSKTGATEPIASNAADTVPGVPTTLDLVKELRRARRESKMQARLPNDEPKFRVDEGDIKPKVSSPVASSVPIARRQVVVELSPFRSNGQSSSQPSTSRASRTPAIAPPSAILAQRLPTDASTPLDQLLKRKGIDRCPPVLPRTEREPSILTARKSSLDSAVTLLTKRRLQPRKSSRLRALEHPNREQSPKVML